jgi:Protein of unknown function (DUF3617)
MIRIARGQRFSFLVSSLICFCSPALDAAERMISGQWEFTMTTDGSTRTSKQCMTPEKASEFNGDSKSGREIAEKNAKGRCTIKSYEIEGDKVSYSLACGVTEIESVTTFHGDSSEGSMVTTTAGKPVKTEVKARRVGACP